MYDIEATEITILKIVEDKLYKHFPILKEALNTELIYGGSNTFYIYEMGLSELIPQYSIMEIIIAEIYFKLLDRLECIKYSGYYTNASSILNDVWDKYQQKEFPYLPTSNYLIELYEQNQLKTIAYYEPSNMFSDTISLKLAECTPNGHARKKISNYFSQYHNSLGSLKICKINNGITVTPLYSIPTLCQSFALNNIKDSLVTINKINSLKESEPNNELMMYWQYYKNTRFLGLDKENNIKFYRNLFSKSTFLNHLSTIILPTLSERELWGYIEEVFFNTEFINKYKSSDFFDYFILVQHFFIKTFTAVILLHNPRITPTELKRSMQSLADTINNLNSIETNVNPLIFKCFNNLMYNCDNDINRLEQFLIPALKTYANRINFHKT